MGNDDDALLLIFRPAFESRRRHFFFSFFFLVLFFFPFCCLFSFFTSLFACLLLFRVLSLLIAVMGTCIDLYAFSVMIVSVQSSPEFALFIAVSGICYHNYYNLTCLFIFFFRLVGWWVCFITARRRRSARPPFFPKIRNDDANNGWIESAGFWCWSLNWCSTVLASVINSIETDLNIWPPCVRRRFELLIGFNFNLAQINR